jgi:hypothetical protein
VRARDGAKGKNQRDKGRACRQCVGEQCDSGVAAGESLRHDARTDHRGEEKGSSGGFRSQSPGKRHGLISFCCVQDGAIESMIAAPKDWCPNPCTTSCLRLRGSSMSPLIRDGYILVVDSSQTKISELNGKIVIAWHRDKGLTVSRLNQFDHTVVLQSENASYESITLGSKQKWKIVAKVLWWIGKSP